MLLRRWVRSGQDVAYALDGSKVVGIMTDRDVVASRAAGVTTVEDTSNLETP